MWMLLKRAQLKWRLLKETHIHVLYSWGDTGINASAVKWQGKKLDISIRHMDCTSQKPGASYLRSVEKICRGDFTFFSDIFLLCVPFDFSLPFFHCCVTKVCMILQIKNKKKNTERNVSGSCTRAHACAHMPSTQRLERECTFQKPAIYTTHIV